MAKVEGTFRNAQHVRTQQVGGILSGTTKFALTWVSKNFRGKAVFRDFFSVSGFPRAVGADGIMAKIIEFYVPKGFRPNAKWVPASRRGQVIEFNIPKKSA